MDALARPREEVGKVVKTLRVLEAESGGIVTDGPELAFFSEHSGLLRFSRLLRLRGAAQRPHLVGGQPFEKTRADSARAMVFDRGIELFGRPHTIAGGC